MANNLKTTPLNPWHRAAKANMADFGGFDMPLWYETGVKTEHLAVLKSAGIFDTSHMACINVHGNGAFELLNYCFTKDLSKLAQGRCTYGAFLNKEGQCIDDAIVYNFSNQFFMVCVNAGMGSTISRHLDSNKEKFKAVIIEDLSGKIAKIDIQGINSARILSKLIQNPGGIFNEMPYFSFKGNLNEDLLDKSKVCLLNGTPVLLSRSGYTGEFGFEIFIAPDAVVNLWTDIMSTGKPYGITACGLGARDSLRAGACLPLSHQDIGQWKFINHPWEFALPFNNDGTAFTKDFLGAKALLTGSNDGFTYPFAGDSLRKIAPGANTHVLDDNGSVIGRVLTCVTDMGITRHEGKIISVNSLDFANDNKIKDIKISGLSCGFILASKQLEPGSVVTITDGKRKIKVTIETDIRPDRTARKKLDNFI